MNTTVFSGIVLYYFRDESELAPATQVVVLFGLEAVRVGIHGLALLIVDAAVMKIFAYKSREKERKKRLETLAAQSGLRMCVRVPKMHSLDRRPKTRSR